MKRRRAVFTVLLLLAAAAAGSSGADVEITCAPARVTARQGEQVMLQFVVRNRSAFRLETAGNFFLSFHAADASGSMRRFDNRRFPLPVPARPGATTRFALPVYFSLEPGAYRLEWDLVREGEFWGRDKGWKTAAVALDLLPLVAPDFRRAWLPTFYESGREWLDSMQYLLRQVLRNNEIRHHGKLFAFAAGTTYPQAWIRDTATMTGYARFFYPPPFLQGIVDRFFLAQSRQGEIQDWVDASGRCDKNTVASDQEASLVLAAWPLALDDPGWLAGRIAGVSRLRRLDMALDWLWQNRRDPARGLIWSGFTADWGDVERSYSDHRAIKRLGDMAMAGKWRQRERSVAGECRRQLYLPDHGYFIVHRFESTDETLDWERNILAVGGNAEAMRAGLLDRKKIDRLLRVLAERRRHYRLRSVSYTLLPPYPQGFFPHPLLSSPWSYQNGGEWDWIGGRLVSALYQAGFRDEAETCLQEIAVRSLEDMNIFEWSDRSGNGQGASFFSGAAGILGEALLFGRLGLREEFDRYVVAAAADSYRLSIAKGGDRFHIDNSGPLTIEIESLARKEVCLAIGPGGETVCVAKKGKTLVRKP